MNGTVNNSVRSSFPLEKHVLVRAVVITTSCFTMIGSILVVLSYLYLKSFRSEARQIVLNISLMDFGIGLANFTGAIVHFGKYYHDQAKVSNTIDSLCKLQAFLALFATFASIFWTMSLAVYMYIMVFHNYQRSVLLYLPMCYTLCYGLPIALTIWLLLTNRLGNAPYNSSGWCGIILIQPDDDTIDIFATIVGYDLWIYLTFFLCLTMYSALFIRINVEFRSAAKFVTFQKFWKQALHFLDFKLLLIPLAFFVLRVWTCVINILFIYCAIKPSSLPHSLNLTLIILAGIGDSGQGMTNGLIFVISVKKIRQNLFSLNWIRKCRNRHWSKLHSKNKTNTPLLINSGDIVTTDNNLTPTNSLTYTFSS